MRARPRLPAVPALVLAVAALVPARVAAQAPEAASVTIDVLETPSERTLLGVSFPTATAGYAVGDQGVILATTDGGATWKEQASGVPGIDPTCNTGPGGEPIESTCTNALFDVDFVDATTGWAVGSDGIVLHTGDGGTTWARQPLPSLDSIAGLGPGPGGTDLRPSGWDDLFSVSFPDPRAGAVAGPGGTILVTADGGATWQWRGDRRYGGLTELTFADRHNGQAVGLATTGLSPYISVATADGGTSWELRQPPPRSTVANANFSGVDFLDAERGYIAGSTGRILATTDAGHTWVVQRSDTTETFQDIAFGNEKRGLAVGATDFNGASRASLAVTGDGGETWAPRLLDGLILWAVDFATPTTAYAVGCTRQTRVERSSGPIFPCAQSLVARITFPAEAEAVAGEAGGDQPRPGPADGDGDGDELSVDGGSGVSLVLWVGAGAVALVAMAALAVRRPRRH